MSSHLKECDGDGYIAQTPWSEMHEVDAVEETRRRVGHQDLTAVSGRHHPRGQVQHRAEVVVVPLFGFAGGDSHSNR